jgi:hypothetical protein
VHEVTIDSWTTEVASQIRELAALTPVTVKSRE